MHIISCEVGTLALVDALAFLTVIVAAQERDRSKIPDKYKWNLTDLYPSEAAWREAKERLAAQVQTISRFQHRLTASGSVLADALDAMSALDKELSRLAVYANQLADQDTRDAAHQGLRQEMTELAANVAATKSFVEPEILAADRAAVDRLIASEPRLNIYRFYLEDIARRRPHTLSESEERLLAASGPVGESSHATYSILTNADFPYPTITLSDGRAVKIDQAGYADLRALPVRADREKVMSAFFSALGVFRGTLGTTINGEVRKAKFVADARKYGSALDSALDASNIPRSVYLRLIDGMNRNLPSFHRYLRLRRKMMGLDELHYYDLYAPLVASVRLEYTPEEAQDLVLTAVALLGPDYAGVIRRAFNERWIDLLPNDGKRSGAYSEGGAYDVHPYMLINYSGKYADVSTLAHELGHTMQSHLSNKTQPYPLANYPIFVAEVASTFNEALLIEHMLRVVKNDDARLSLLGNYLENIKSTVFRQTQFAEFELRMHEMAQNGQPITGDALDKLYMDITKRYYGAEQGVTVVDDYIAHEWSYIPHFYMDFYVYQYATSFTASLALVEKVKSGDANQTKRYLNFLSAGGSKYPIDLLKDAGVDMTTDEPLDLTISAMNRVMDEMEQILARRR